MSVAANPSLANTAASTAAVARESSRRRTRVLHLITSFEIGGTERQAVELLKRIDRERFDVRLAVLRNEGPFYEEIEEMFPAVPEFPLTSFYNFNAARQLARLRRLMVREEIDILHAHDFYSSFIGAAAARLAGVRVIACQRHLKLSDRRVHRWGTRIIHLLAHRILVNSEAIRDYITAAQSAPEDKIVVVKNGVLNRESSQQRARHSLRDELGLRHNATLIGMVARLQAVKGHRYFLEAASRILQHEPDAHLILVGDGPLRSEIERQVADLGIGANVHFLGDRTDVRDLISGFDFLVLASLHEGLPNAVMEAMVAGVPVVATSVGGTLELITDCSTGYLTPPADSSALASRMLFAMHDVEHRPEIISAARRRIDSEYGMERMIRSVQDLYDRVIQAA